MYLIEPNLIVSRKVKPLVGQGTCKVTWLRIKNVYDGRMGGMICVYLLWTEEAKRKCCLLTTVQCFRHLTYCTIDALTNLTTYTTKRKPAYGCSRGKIALNAQVSGQHLELKGIVRANR